MDEDTVRLGLLMEAARANQKSAETALKRLKSNAQDVASVVREEVHRALERELHSLKSDCDRAAAALYAVRRAANLRVALWSLGMTALCSSIPLALALWLIPSRAQIEALNSRHAALAAEIAVLEQRGARIDLRRCGAGARLCVRVDRRAPAYGEEADYLVVRGY